MPTWPTCETTTRHPGDLVDHARRGSFRGRPVGSGPLRHGDPGGRGDGAEARHRRLDRRPQPERERVRSSRGSRPPRCPIPASAPANPSGTTTPASSWPALDLLAELFDRRDLPDVEPRRVGLEERDERCGRRVARRHDDAEAGAARAAELQPERHDDDRRQHEHEEQVRPVPDLAEEVDPGDVERLRRLDHRGATSRRARSIPRPPVTRPIVSSTATAGRQSAAVEPVPCMSPRPRRNQPWGVNSDSVASTSGALEVGENVPPRMPRVMATAPLAAARGLGRAGERRHERRDPDRRDDPRDDHRRDPDRRPPVGVDEERRRHDERASSRRGP